MRPGPTWDASFLTSNLDFGLFRFPTVTSGNPDLALVKGRGVRSITRTGAGRYDVVITGAWETFFEIGANPGVTTADVDAHINAAVPAADGKTTTMEVVVTSAGSPSDLSGGVPITVIYAGHAGGDII